MTVTASGIINAPLYALRDMFAESTEFQTWTSQATADLARERCFVSITSERPSMPFIVLDHHEFVRRRTSLGQTNAFNTEAGAAAVYFRREVNTAIDLADDYITFCNELGDMISAIEGVAGIYEQLTLAVFTISMLKAPQLNDAYEQQSSGEFWEAVFALDWSRQP